MRASFLKIKPGGMRVQLNGQIAKRNVFSWNDRRKRRAKLLCMALPLVGLVLVFNYLPLFGWSYAFVDFFPGVALKDSNFAGLKYFMTIFSPMSDFPTVIRNTLVLSALRILTTPVPILFAILLSQLRSARFSRFVQTVSSIPNFISWVLVYAIFFAFFSSEDAVFNRLMMALGIFQTPHNLLGDNAIAWQVQTGVGSWKWTGWDAIIYISAMTGIDPDLYAAADVDGAGRFKKILHVTLPGIMPTFFVLFLLTVANLLGNGFEQFYVFQNPVTIDKLEVLDTYIYRMGIVSAQYSFATAMGVFKSELSIGLLTLANWLSRAVRGEAIV